MSSNFTRRDFLSNAAQAGLISQLELGPARADEAAKTQPTRRVGFDDGWRFARGDTSGAQAPEFHDQAWSQVDVPHDWSIAGPYSETEPTGGSGGYLPTGVGWYRKQFALPASAAGRRVAVQFDGVYQRSEVWINGQPLGMRPYGYISFAYDLTPHIRFGGEPNVFAVRVDNSLQPNSRWYSGSGIYRHVWLVQTDHVHITQWGVAVRTSAVSKTSATVEINTRVANETAHSRSCTLRMVIHAPNGSEVKSAEIEASVPRSGLHTFVHRLRIDRPELWSLESPALYSLRTNLASNGEALDTETTAFGVRDARFDADRGFLLNGERIKLNGVCLHHDGGAVGAAVPERLWERRLELLKDMGCNAIRTSHNPPAPEFLDLCDRMGIVVMGEAFDEWRQPKAQTPQYGYRKYFDEWAARDISDMIERDGNHPCVVIWSAGNEVPDQTDPKGPQTLQGLLDVFHAKDPTRLVTVGCDNIVAEPKAAPPEFLEKLDVVGYNYVDRWRDRREKFYSIDRHDYPKRRFIGTESSAMGGVRGTYEFGDEAPVFGERTDNRRIAVEQLQKFVQTYDYVAGDFMWTGIDYLGEARWPNKLAVSGVIDTCGFPKDGFYFYQSQWTTKPVLHLFPHWNWKGKEGEVITVTCYTNCETVELFLNGKTLGVKGYAFPRPGMIETWPTYPTRAKALQTTADLHLTWDVPYAPGTLKAVGTRNGQVISTIEVSTTGDEAAIRLSVDRSRIHASRGDVAHVKVEVVDRHGRLVPTAENDIAFDLKGNGKIIGVDNGRPDSHESYQAHRRKTFNGLALALLQSVGRSGSMTLTASSQHLDAAQIEVLAGSLDRT
jgi:beta-galactosidase